MSLKETKIWFKIHIMKGINCILKKLEGITSAVCKFLMLIFFIAWMESCDTRMNGSFIGEDAVTIAAYIENNPKNYSRYLELMISTNLKSALNAYNPHGNGYTVFLPTNEAFDKFIRSTEKYNSFEDLLSDTEFSYALARYHIVNRGIKTNDFPYGALQATNATGDFLTIGFEVDNDSTIYKVNNAAPVIIPNIELINGYIHVIDEMLVPILYSSYEWILSNANYSLLSEAFKISGIDKDMSIYRTNNSGSNIRNYYTLLAEPDSVYHAAGIFTIDDLIDKYNTQGMELNDIENEFYQFLAYHILEGSYFLDEFVNTRNYNTFANFPVQISAGIEIKINPGKDTLDIIFNEGDTTIIDFVRMDMLNSNILTKNGAIHILKDIMEVYTPERTNQVFQFYEEPLINNWKNTSGEFDLLDPESLEVLDWTGPEGIKYYYSSSAISASNNDYIEIQGNFTLNYITPEILPGKYQVRIKSDCSNTQNASIQVYIDGKRMGSSFDLTSGGNPFKTFSVGSVEFFTYESHQISINSLIPGFFKWDFIQFIPE